MPMKLMMRYHVTPVKMSQNASVGEDVEKREYSLDRTIKGCSHYEEQYGRS